MTCYNSRMITNKYTGEPVLARCRRCIGCVISYAREWSIRCVHEAKFYIESSFLTLTYDNDKLPSDGLLNHKDVQLFLKRLRKFIHPVKVRYLVVGEYGDGNGRPHYHMLLYGYDFSSDRVKVSKRSSYYIYTSNELSGLWQKGFCSIGAITEKSASYVAKYCFKKPLRRGDPSAPYMRCSKGIGKSWALLYAAKCLDRGYIVYENRKYAIPRYYIDIIDRFHLASGEKIDYYKRRRLEHCEQCIHDEYQKLKRQAPDGRADAVVDRQEAIREFNELRQASFKRDLTLF